MNDEQGIMNIEGYSSLQHSEFVIQYSIFVMQPLDFPAVINHAPTMICSPSFHAKENRIKRGAVRVNSR